MHLANGEPGEAQNDTLKKLSRKVRTPHAAHANAPHGFPTGRSGQWGRSVDQSGNPCNIKS